MVYILLAPGFEETEALAPADLLRRANIETALVSLTGESVPGRHGITVAADMGLDEVDLSKADMIVLPGGAPGYKNLGADPRVERLVREAAERDLWIAAICAAPTLLGRWGLLEGKPAVCNPAMEVGLMRTRAWRDRAMTVVTDGKIITGRAAGSAFEFGLSLIEALAGEEKAGDIRDSVCY